MITRRILSLASLSRSAAYRAALLLFLLGAALPATDSSANSVEPAALGESGVPRAVAERSDTLQTKEGLTLRLTTDLGSVRIVPLEAGAAPVVRYSVRIETDARPPLAEKLLARYSLTAKATPLGVEIAGSLPSLATRSGNDAQFWVHYEVAVPATYNVEVSTGAGDIYAQDINGAASLITQGGNIAAGRIGFTELRAGPADRPTAKLSTQGGHIRVMDVAGDLDAFTAGGHISAGNIAGDAMLRTGGGHIRAGQIAGRAQLETEGGNVTLGQAGSFVTVRTGGGQIDFGEVRGSVRAQTGGGGIRIITVSGPMEVESNGGSICLTRVAGAVQAATAGGTIRAWINPDAPSTGRTVHLAGASQLSSGAGDIIIFLPRNLAANIDALVENGGASRIDADPALLLSIQPPANRTSGPVHATAVLNGGGAVLKLRTTVGKIKLQFLDSDTGLRDSLIREQRERINRRREGDSFPPVPVSLDRSSGSEEAPTAEEKTDWLERWMGVLEIKLRGGLQEDAGDFQKRLISSPRPAYPELARRTGIQGIVKLQVRVMKNGSLEVQKLLQGEPVLADAAIEAVKKWRAKPAWINGEKVEVISTVTFNFQLH